MLIAVENELPQPDVKIEFDIEEFKHFQASCDHFNSSESSFETINGRPYSCVRYNCQNPPLNKCSILTCPLMSVKKKTKKFVVVDKKEYDELKNMARVDSVDEYDITVKMDPVKTFKMKCMSLEKNIEIKNALLNIKHAKKYKKISKEIQEQLDILFKFFGV